MNRHFFWGVVTGIAGTWVFHKFVRPLPGGSAQPGG